MMAKTIANKPKWRPPELDLRFAAVVRSLAQHPDVSRGEGKGFGSGALQVKGRIFAMMTSKGEFVVKLPKQRVDELVGEGKGQRFDPGHGRLMKEWVVIPPGKASWAGLAEEACEFVKSRF